MVNADYMIDNIKHISDTAPIDMVIMGISKKGRLTQQLMGSFSLAVAHDIDIPVLIVPHDFKYTAPKKILLCIPDKVRFTEKIPVGFLKNIAGKLHTPISVLTVCRDKMLHNEELRKEHELFVTGLQEYAPKYIKTEGASIAKSILSVAHEEHAGWICTIAEEHSFWNLMFNGSVTTDLAYNPDFPVLVLSPQQA